MSGFYCRDCDTVMERYECVETDRDETGCTLQCPACGEEVEDLDYDEGRDPIRAAVDAALLEVVIDIARGLRS